jgi:hypothetical protein|tara:strand:- start:924 stop:1352 length:429 start_codon:yes stop_codon:yes gene_type:complete
VIGLITNVAPIFIGFVMKLVAIKSKAATDLQKLQLEALSAREGVISSARKEARNESPWAALNRRVIIFVLLGIIIFTQVAPVFLNVPTVIPTVIEGFSFLGIELTPDKIEYITVEGLLKLDSVFQWTTIIIEFYFGAQLAKG